MNLEANVDFSSDQNRSVERNSAVRYVYALQEGMLHNYHGDDTATLVQFLLYVPSIQLVH